MKIIVGYPPNIDAIAEKYPQARTHNVLFAFGTCIYNPKGFPITKGLLAHETVHCTRQGSDVEGWWKRYLSEPAFVLEEEVHAHRKEFWVMARGVGTGEKDRLLDAIAKRLSGPLYKSMIDYETARKLVLSTAPV